MAVTRIEVDPESIIGEVGAMSASELDALPFGAIRLDPAGTILNYNKSESGSRDGRQRTSSGRTSFRTLRHARGSGGSSAPSRRAWSAAT